VVERGRGLPCEAIVEPAADARRHRLSGIGVHAVEAVEQRRELQLRPAGIVRRARVEEVGPADRLGEGPQPEGREEPPHLLGDEEEIRLDLLGRRVELRAELGTLGRDADRTGVDVTRAHHQAALREQQRRPEAHLVGAEQRRDEHVAARLDPAVRAEPHPAAQAGGDERLLRLRQSELPRGPRVLDRGQRACARAAVRARDVHDVGEGLGDARSDDPHAGL
jgi:hypothetical protein